MTDLVIGVRVKADGSGLVGQLAPTQAAIRDLKQEMGGASQAAGQFSAATGAAGQASRQAATGLDSQGRAAGELEAILTRLEGTYDKAGAPMRRYQQDLADISRLQKAGAIDIEHAALLTSRANSVYAEHSKVQKAGAVSAGQLRAASANLGFQIQDTTQQLALGINPLVVLAQQGGQTASAIAAMGGKGASVAAFFASGWGSAILAAVTVVGLLITSLGDTEESLDTLVQSADSFGRAQSDLGKVMDLVTGKFTEHNAVLRETIRLRALLGMEEARKARADARNALLYDQGFFASAKTILGIATIHSAPAPDEALPTPELRDLRSRFLDGSVGIKQVREELDRLAASGKTADESVTDLLEKFLKFGIASNDIEANQAIIDALDGKGLDPRLRKPGRTRKPRKSNAAGRLEEFGEDAENRIAGIAGRFIDDSQPRIIEEARKAMAGLDDLIDDIRRKKPLNMEQLLADAETAKTTVRDGLIRGIAEPFEEQKTLADKARSALAALDTVAADLQQRKPPGLAGFLDQIEEARQTINDGLNRPYNEFIKSQDDALQVQQLIADGREDEAQALQIIIGLEKKMGPLSAERKDAVLDTVQALRAEERQLDINRKKQQKYLDALGDIRSLVSDILSGNLDALKDAPQRLISSFKQLQGQFLTEKLFGPTFRELQDQITGTRTVEDASDRMAAAVDKASASIARLGDAAEGAATGVATTAQQDANHITVTASSVPLDPVGFFSHTIEKLAEGVLSKEAAKTIGDFAARGLQGAAVGATVAGVGKLLGIKTSSTGGQIGGAIGSVLPIPGGSIIGSIIGSVLGGLFHKTRTGTATVTSVDGPISLGGNSGSRRDAAENLAGSVQDALQQIADQLGGGVGDFAVSIGIRDKQFRVDPTGQGQTKKKKGAVDFDEDQAAAVAFAIADAIKDGAITGLSAAVQRALQSSTDIDKALREALKVDEVETLLGGIGAELEKTFQQFERQAAERVRIARQYGFDLVKLEQVNVEQRAKVFEDVLQSRIGSLQQLLDDLNFGDLFEGSAADQRQALLVQIAKAKSEAEAGKEGAADTLAQLERKLVDLSRDAFGTAGAEFASDRAGAKSAAEEIIKIENDRVKAAQDAAIATNQKLDTNNQLTNETNDLLAETNALLRGLGGGGGGTGSAKTFSTARTVSL